MIKLEKSDFEDFFTSVLKLDNKLLGSKIAITREAINRNQGVALFAFTFDYPVNRDKFYEWKRGMKTLSEKTLKSKYPILYNAHQQMDPGNAINPTRGFYIGGKIGDELTILANRSGFAIEYVFQACHNKYISAKKDEGVEYIEVYLFLKITPSQSEIDKYKNKIGARKIGLIESFSQFEKKIKLMQEQWV